MFGYISPDLPNLFIKDAMLYKALYCGLCKGISSACGQLARMGLSYDVTFLSALLHNIKNVDIEVEQSHCVEHPIKKRPIAKPDELTKALACVNTVWTYYKLTDDIEDENRGRLKRLWFAKGFQRVKKENPRIVEIVERRMGETSALEKEGCDSIDRMADGTAMMLKELSDYLLEDYATEETGRLFYLIGKWIYLIDAVDDYDKDKKKGLFNVFALAYGAESKEALLKEQRGELDFLFKTLFFGVRECLQRVKLHFNHDLTDNILMLGLPNATNRILCAQSCADCKKDKTLKKL
ncbi:MAG: hypothetical protein J6D37_06520 [Clostridia bacterium]|nr:hypothetical protein [Clostridia bacterium]